MHKALYREYRPKKFDDVIGQGHIIKTLKNQIESNNLGHAYLFSGTRGTGKTSTAKIFSRAINCKNCVDGEPCNECESCRSILNDGCIDVVEIDAASNNSVDDIRELRENVKYSPSNMKFKVYIIDEVHMLSIGAFNALLKTLEEPPSYVVFVLATTDPQKLPATIVSRCQRFDFKRVTVKDMTFRMVDICKSENVEFDEKALNLIARNSQGALRDCLSILDQCISFSDGKVFYDDVVEILGTANLDQLFEFSESIINKDSKKSIEILNDFVMWGKDIKILLNDLIEHFRNIMIAKISNDLEDIVCYSDDIVEKLVFQSSLVSIDEIIRIINILSKTNDEMKYSSNQRVLFEICVIKIAQPRFDDSYNALLSRVEVLEKSLENGVVSLKKEEVFFDDDFDEKIDIVTNKDICDIENSWDNIVLKIDEYKNLENLKDVNVSFFTTIKMKKSAFSFDISDNNLFICVNKGYEKRFENKELQAFLIKKAIKEVLSKNFNVFIVSSDEVEVKKSELSLYDEGLEKINSLINETNLEIK